MRYLITSALPYINGVKHLGTLAGSQLPADVQARFRRMQGEEVLFICATDEHGTPAELGAVEAGQSVQQYCDEQHKIQKDIAESFGLSFDWFGRSSNKPNRLLTQHFCEILEKNGLIEERTSRQVYSVDDKRFLPDRYVEGTCPKCGFERARGDQCDKCGELLDPTDLLNPRSKISGSTNIEHRETAHLYQLFSKCGDQVRAWVDKVGGQWPQLARSIAYKWLDEGLQDSSITRDLSWGVPVTKDGKPRPGFENKVFYVWFDAPIEYIGATQEWAEGTGGNWERWWRTDKGAEDVCYIEFMGKDNVAFHTIRFPAALIGSGEPWKLVDRLKAFNWVNWYGGKFSTSEKRGVFLDHALELLPADYWRWYLMANAPESSDASFTWELFQSTINSDLANILGNFVNRITRFTASKFESKVPEGGVVGAAEEKLFAELDERLARLTELHDQMEFRKAAAETRALWVLGNEYLANAAPWTSFKTDVAASAVAVRTGLNLCLFFAAVSAPFIPHMAEKIAASFGVSAKDLKWPSGKAADILSQLKPGQAITPPDVLVQKIEDEWVTAQSERFGGAAN